MHLLELDSNGKPSLTRFIGNNIPSYAILSHTWEADDQEVTFKDLTNGVGLDKIGNTKIEFCGEQARKDGLRFFWVDSCCIDKSSSAELSEAINSMFSWYRDAAKCYVYLSDVSTGKHSRSSEPMWEFAFRRSRWFTRGWTLQELLAARSVQFFSRDRKLLGDKKTLERTIHEITGISVHALQGAPLSQFTVDERLSWAAKRETTIKEDQAYCLLGLFDIHLPLIYGEGSDNAFIRLRQEINRRSSSSDVDPDQARQKSKCLQTLRTSNYEQFKDRNSGRLEGTCQWFLQHTHFAEWEQSASSSLLWVSADPGCGKSVLSKSLVDEDLYTESRVICHFFFKDDNEKQKGVTTALSAILHQLFSQAPSLIVHALPEYKAEGKQLPQLFHKLWNILVKAATDPEAGEIVCVLDALDECEESGRYLLINTLNTFYNNAQLSKSAKLKFVVTSRPYFDIERRFVELTRNFPSIRLQGEKESEAIGREINIVIRWSIPKLGSELGLDDSEQSVLEFELLSMKHRTYLWLKLIFEVLRDEVSLTTGKLKRIIGTLPATVDQAYEAILSKIPNKERPRAQKLLRIIIVATQPLTLNEMNIALAIEDHHKSYGNLELENKARFESTIRNICGLFVTVMDSKIYLIHQTARQFLVTKAARVFDSWKHSLTLVDSDLLMAKICVTYLMFSEFENRSEQTRRRVAMKYYDFHFYAAAFWPRHFRRAQAIATTNLQHSILELCDPQCERFSIWFSIYTHGMFKSSSLESPLSKLSKLLVSTILGHETIVEQLLKMDTAEIDSKDRYGETPLFWAAKTGHDAIVRLLLKTGKADITSRNSSGQTPLSLAAIKGSESVVRLLLETGEAIVETKDTMHNRTPLLWAAAEDHETVVRLLLEMGKADINSQDKDGRTPLLLAAVTGSEAVVRLLLETGKVNINSKDKEYGQTPLSLAAENGHMAVVKLLLETGKAEIKIENYYGGQLLSWAASYGSEEIVRLLLARDDVEAGLRESDGRTPLFYAARYGHDKVVQLLLARDDVEADLKDHRYGWTPLSYAARYGHEEVVRMLLARDDVGADSRDHHYGWTPLSYAARYGHEAVVQMLQVRHDVKVNSKDSDGRTPLSYAARYGHETVVQILVARDDVEADSKNNYGQTPLSYAARYGHEAVVQMLLGRQEVEANLKDSDGRTPLSYAAAYGHKTAVQILVARDDIEADSKDDYGQTPLSFAVQNHHNAVVELLVKTGKVDINSKDINGRTPLFLAAYNGNEAVVEILLKTGKADIASKDVLGRTPLSWAADNGYEVMFKLLLEAGKTDVNSKGEDDQTSLS